MFIYFTALCSVASELPVLVVLRFLDGCVGSVPIVIGGGTIADMYAPETRGRAMSVYMMSAMMGPPMGPIVAAVITQKLGWRWIFGAAAIASATLSIVCFFYLEETHEETVLRRHKKKKTEQKRQRVCKLSWPHFELEGSEKIANSLRQPFILLFTDRAVLVLGIYQAFAYGYMIFMLTSFSNVFIGQYGFSTSTSGLPYLGIAVGFGVGVVITSTTSDRIASALTLQNDGVRIPAFRLPLMAWSCWIPPIALAGYGWSAFYKVHFMVPIAAVALYSIGLQLIMVYLSEAHKTRVASAIAAVTVLRCLLGSVLPLVGEIMYEKLGLGWGNTLLAFMAFALMPLPWLIMRSGQRAGKEMPLNDKA
ncbi:hypothetical protein N0V93_004100 [Gnomoniopsis smithogilvyi]|uniref:Major facilitator superfamily (MFS) profile domain-containing protein n=1 Tax=Gnomoniopsis smithogilvyi TaxID=1191159 RepID=A0A9W8Z230_9PEZI|nr:hypothetical protein N0V93_004100 [Gnomoniopsis smithogilvyi]